MTLLSRSRTGGELVADVLEAAGLSTVISLPGSQVLPIWDGLREKRVRLLVPRSERSGAFMAEGFGRASGKPAVLMDTLGPGVANELLGFASARASQAPLISIAPFQPPRKRERIAEVFQGLDHPKFFAAFSKWTRVVESADEIAPAVTSALQHALRPPRGPVRVEIAFPLLFAHSRAKHDRPSMPAVVPARERLLCVCETKDSNSSFATNVLGALVEQRETGILAPGIDEPGHAIPFALGAKLGRPELPVVVVTEARFVLRHLGVLLVAREHGVRLGLVSPPEAALERAARAITLERIGAPGDARWAEAVEAGPRLWLVCADAK